MTIFNKKRREILNKFEGLSPKDLLLAFKFYGKGVEPPGRLDSTTDQVRAWEALDKADGLIKKGEVGLPVHDILIDSLKSFSLSSLEQMDRELSACELFDVRKAEPSRRTVREAAELFHDMVDGMDVGSGDFEREVAKFEELGFVVISPKHDINDESYKPLNSGLEKVLSQMNLGSNDSNDCFAVEKDGYEALVIEHSGEYFLSNWVYDRESGKAEFIQLEPLDEELLKVAGWAQPLASPTAEPMTGRYASQFIGVPKWDRSLDFPVGDVPGFVGLRYKDFEASKAIHALFDDGESVSVDELSYLRQKRVLHGLKDVFAEAQKIYTAVYDVHDLMHERKEPVPDALQEKYSEKMYWSRGDDFKVKGWPEFSGIRYLEFPSHQDAFVLKKDGEAVKLHDVSLKQLRALDAGLKDLLKKQSVKRTPVKGVKI